MRSLDMANEGSTPLAASVSALLKDAVSNFMADNAERSNRNRQPSA